MARDHLSVSVADHLAWRIVEEHRMREQRGGWRSRPGHYKPLGPGGLPKFKEEPMEHWVTLKNGYRIQVKDFQHGEQLKQYDEKFAHPRASSKGAGPIAYAARDAFEDNSPVAHIMLAAHGITRVANPGGTGDSRAKDVQPLPSGMKPFDIAAHTKPVPDVKDIAARIRKGLYDPRVDSKS